MTVQDMVAVASAELDRLLDDGGPDGRVYCHGCGEPVAPHGPPTEHGFGCPVAFAAPPHDPSYAVLGGLWREIAPGVLTDRTTVQLWQVEPCAGFVLVLLCVDKR